MKLLFASALFCFALIKLGRGGRTNSSSKYLFSDVEPAKNGLKSQTVSYSLMDDLAKTDEFTPNFVTAYDELSFPNPFVQPEECVLSLGISHSWLCDPEHYLTMEEQVAIEAGLLRIRDMNFHKCYNNRSYFYQVGVAIVPQVVKIGEQTYAEAAELFANSLLRKWGIGNKECHDGILLVYVKQLGRLIVARREGVEDKDLNEAEVRTVFMNTYFATGSLARALNEAIEYINRSLPSRPQEMTDTAKIFLYLITLYILSIMILYFTTTAYNKNI